MKTYFDTGLLIKAYVPENGSELVDLLLRSSTVPVPFTHLHSVEARTALRLKRFRSELTAEELSGALDAIDADLARTLTEGGATPAHYNRLTVRAVWGY